MSIFIERKSRRSELALYAFPRAADSLFATLLGRPPSPPPPPSIHLPAVTAEKVSRLLYLVPIRRPQVVGLGAPGRAAAVRALLQWPYVRASAFVDTKTTRAWDALKRVHVALFYALPPFPAFTNIRYFYHETPHRETLSPLLNNTFDVFFRRTKHVHSRTVAPADPDGAASCRAEHKALKFSDPK